MIQSLQSLRGIFAIFIFLHHYHYKELHGLFPAGGDCGVSFFFILSGFVLCIGYQKRITGNATGILEFMRRRVSKIYPLHLICFLWAFSLLRFNIRPSEIGPMFCNIFMVQSWVPKTSYYYSFNAVGWCLSDFMFFYLMFPWLVKKATLNRHRFIAITLLLTTAWVMSVSYIPDDLTEAIVYINPLARLLDFSIGIVLWISYEKISKTQPHGADIKTQNIMQCLSLLALCATIWLYPSIPMCWGLASYWWIPCSSVIMTFATQSRGFVSRLLETRWLIWFGDVSFTFYLIHVLGMNTTDILMSKMHIDNLSVALNFTIVLASDILLTYFISTYILTSLNRFKAR